MVPVLCRLSKNSTPESGSLVAVLCATILLLAVCAAADVSADQAGQVLVLHSFHQGWHRTDAISEGIQEAFAPLGHRADLYFEYLDLQRDLQRDSQWQGDNDLPGAVVHLLKARLAERRFDAVIAVGAAALAFVRRNDYQTVSSVPVIFCDVDTVSAAAALPGQETGIVARQNHLATLQMMLQLHPDCRRIVMLSGQPVDGVDAATDLTRAIAKVAPRVTLGFWEGPDLSGLPARLVGLASGDLIYLPGFDPAEREQAVYADESMCLIARWSPVPAYSASDFFLGKGIAGGVITTGRRQGELAGQMALRVLSGTAVSAIPVVEQSPDQYLFDGRVLYRYAVALDRLPEGSVIIHPVPGFWTRHSNWLPAAGALMVLLPATLLVLLMRQRKQQLTLQQSNVELDGRVRERTAHLKVVSQKLKKQTVNDPVTGLANRRYIQQRYAEEFKKSQRYGHPMTVLLLSVDRFKEISGEYSYMLAEQLLRDVGHCIRGSIREVDIAGRYGGESFMVILPNTEDTQGHVTAERIRRNVGMLQWAQGALRATLSVALVQYREHSPSELLETADGQLKAAKSRGGDRIMASKI